MNSTQIAELQAEQHDVLTRIYDLSYKSQVDPKDSFIKHDLDAARADYDQIVKDIQLLHPLGANCPAFICDQDLAFMYSDMHKSAYGFRYRGDRSVQQMKDDLPYLQAAIHREEELWAEIETRLNAERVEDEIAAQEEIEIIQAYCTDYDHHDPRLLSRLPTSQQFAVLSLVM
jgi:hypothetical protein